jgi:DNA-binding IscR family transcriptional regulator
MDTRFAIAVHVLVLLSTPQGRGLKADLIARNVGTHPVRIRRILAQLATAGFTETVRGRAGGTFLAMEADKIDLAAVHAAIYDDPVFFPLHENPDRRTRIGALINVVMLEPIAAAEALLRESLRTTTIAQLARKITHGYGGGRAL